MLDIVMPHYKEPWETGRPFYEMLACQKGIDFEQIRVILVHDGTEPFSDETFANYPYQVEQYRIEHKGVSAARNFGMDHAKAKWITFCDFDDTYYGIYSLKFVFDVLDTNDYDLLWNPFFVENRNESGNMIIADNHKFNLVWTHNKYYRLDFLREIGLRFNEELYFCEDSAFNALLNCDINPERIGTIQSPMPLYVWCYRDGSATTDKALLLHNMIGHFYRNKYVAESFYKKGNEDADAMVGRTMTDLYVSLTRDNPPEGSDKLEKIAREFFIEHKAALRKIDAETWQKVMRASVREALGLNTLNPERPLFGDWLKKLEKGVIE